MLEQTMKLLAEQRVSVSVFTQHSAAGNVSYRAEVSSIPKFADVDPSFPKFIFTVTGMTQEELDEAIQSRMKVCQPLVDAISFNGERRRAYDTFVGFGGKLHEVVHGAS